METQPATVLTVKTTVNAPIEKVWNYFTVPEHITKWNNASDDWHTPSAVNDLTIGGSFSYRMEAKDGSFGFDFGGVYSDIQTHKYIAYTIGDGRKVTVLFAANGNNTNIVESFEAENMHSLDMQLAGWQSILDNFKKYTEAN